MERKDDSLVRAYMGHTRLDTPELRAFVSDLHDQPWECYNLFQPVLHLIGKEVRPDAVGG